MSKKKQPKYFDPPSPKEMEDLERKIEQIKLAARKKKKLKIEPYVSTVSTCLRDGKSSRHIVKIVRLQHKVILSKDTVLRFAKSSTRNIGTTGSMDQP